MKHVKQATWALTLALLSTALWAADDAGVVKTRRGSVVVERSGQKLDAVVGTRILSSDRITTAADSAVGITLRDNTVLSAGPNSTVDLNKFAFNTTTHAGTIDASVKRGTLSVISGKIAKATPEAVSFSAPGMTLGVRGTSFVIDAGP